MVPKMGKLAPLRKKFDGKWFQAKKSQHKMHTRSIEATKGYWKRKGYQVRTYIDSEDFCTVYVRKRK